MRVPLSPPAAAHSEALPGAVSTKAALKAAASVSRRRPVLESVLLEAVLLAARAWHSA